MDQMPKSPRQRQRGFSFRSDKSGSSKGKGDLTESPQEKARRDSIWKNSSKANPNAALSEAQPGTLNLIEESTLQPLRTIQHKDVNGNPIVDPDLSNPTRPRMERPLDTIRSFERAIDDGYKRRSSYRAEAQQEQYNQYASRRSSYFGGYDNSQNRQSMVGSGYYGNPRPESGHMGQNGRMRYNPRMASDGAIGYGHRPYPQHGYHQSQDTMNTGYTNGSDSTGPWANSTDPSSENSSIENSHNGKQPAHGQNAYGPGGYGPNSYGSPPIMEEQGQTGYYGGPVQAPGGGQPSGQRRPIPLGNSGDTPTPSSPGKLPTNPRPEPEKKKSWIKRRFSKAS